MKHHSTLLFKEKNYFFMLLGFAIIALGFILMSGGGSVLIGLKLIPILANVLK